MSKPYINIELDTIQEGLPAQSKLTSKLTSSKSRTSDTCIPRQLVQTFQ